MMPLDTLTYLGRCTRWGNPKVRRPAWMKNRSTPVVKAEIVYRVLFEVPMVTLVWENTDPHTSKN